MIKTKFSYRRHVSSASRLTIAKQNDNPRSINRKRAFAGCRWWNDHRHVSILPYRQSRRNFHNVVRDPLLRWRNSIVVLNATNVTVERTRTRQHIWITWRAIASLSRRLFLERPLLGEIKKDDPSVRKIRTYMLREIRVPFVYPIPPQCPRATKTLDVRFIVLLFTSRPKRRRLNRVEFMRYEVRRVSMSKIKKLRGNKWMHAFFFFFFLIRFEIRSFFMHGARTGWIEWIDGFLTKDYEFWTKLENGIPNAARRRTIYRSMLKSVNSGITSAEWPGCGFSNRRFPLIANMDKRTPHRY